MDNIIFDLDGTLIDSSIDILESLKFSYKKNNINYNENLVNTGLIGPPIRKIIEMITPELDEEKAFSIISDFRKTYDFCLFENTVMYDGIKELLFGLKKLDKKLFIATNKPLKATSNLLNILNIDIFDDIVTVDSISSNISSKAEMLQFLIDKWNLEENYTIMVGDSISDINAALLNKVKSIAVLYGFETDKESLIQKANISAKNSYDLLNILLKGNI